MFAVVLALFCERVFDSYENCDHGRGHRQTDRQTHTQTDASDNIICHMLCSAIELRQIVQDS